MRLIKKPIKKTIALEFTFKLHTLRVFFYYFIFSTTYSILKCSFKKIYNRYVKPYLQFLRCNIIYVYSNAKIADRFF